MSLYVMSFHGPAQHQRIARVLPAEARPGTVVETVRICAAGSKVFVTSLWEPGRDVVKRDLVRRLAPLDARRA